MPHFQNNTVFYLLLTKRKLSIFVAANSQKGGPIGKLFFPLFFSFFASLFSHPSNLRHQVDYESFFFTQLSEQTEFEEWWQDAFLSIFFRWFKSVGGRLGHLGLDWLHWIQPKAGGCQLMLYALLSCPLLACKSTLFLQCLAKTWTYLTPLG